jgi:hypothetical protein
VVEQRAAGDRTERDRQAGDRGPRANRRGSFLSVGERVAEDRQGGRENHGRGQAHQAAGRDQRADAAREAGEGREPGERGEPKLEGALAPVPIAQAPASQQQRGEDQRVRVDDPLKLACRSVQPSADRGERDVDDRVVNDREKNAQAQNRQDRPPTAVDCRSVRRVRSRQPA